MHYGVSAERLRAARKRVLRVRNSVAPLNSLHKIVEEARISASGSGSCEMALPKSWGQPVQRQKRELAAEGKDGRLLHSEHSGPLADSVASRLQLNSGQKPLATLDSPPASLGRWAFSHTVPGLCHVGAPRSKEHV
jgi:hypothetical protein